MACSAEEVSGVTYLQQLRTTLAGDGDELVQLVAAAVQSSEADASTMLFAEELGLKSGVSGFVYHSVPIALHAWLTHPHDYRGAVMAAIECGGDTDSTAAIVGGIVGAAVGKEGIPSEWLARLVEWPRSKRWMIALGEQLIAVMESGVKARPIRMAAWGVIPRNVLFLLVVLFHGLRRLLPPF
jgi:ADP-ribosylglycohydrolase